MEYCPKCGTMLEWDKRRIRPRKICARCGFVLYENPVPVIAAIVIHEEKVVVVQPQEQRSLWGLPGGYVEPDESLENAVIREVKEETNLDIIVMDYIGSYPWTNKDRKILFIVFLAQSISGSFKAQGDIQQALLLPPKEAYEQLTGRLAKKALSQWMEQQ